MNRKIIIVESGSTNTKGYIYENGNIKAFPFVNIRFKKNYLNNNNKILDEDKIKLYNYINSIKGNADEVYTFGTSIFRDLDDNTMHSLLEEFKKNTSTEFQVVSSNQENELTVYGAIKDIIYDGNIAVMVGGGGSTEISICNNGKIIETANSNFGVIDTEDKYGDLCTQYASSDRDEIVEYIKRNLNKPKQKADILILAGGNHLFYYTKVNYPLVKNKFFYNDREPLMISAEKRDKYDLEFYYNINLDDLRKLTPENPQWWNETRGLCAFSKYVSDIVGAKIIIPTGINMVYGLLDKIVNKS